MITETYYAIRIGDPKRHSPYLMLNKGQLEPKLFAARAVADEFLGANKDTSRKVVKVKVSYAGFHERSAMSGIYEAPDGQTLHGDGKPIGHPPEPSSLAAPVGSNASVDKLEKCPRCRGKGKWQNINCTAMDDDVICPDCNGRGYRPSGVNGEGI